MRVENNLDTDQVRGLVWRLAFPSMLAQFVNVLYSIVDRMYIGNIEGIGAVALAGVGICGPVVTLISSFASWIGVGGAPLMSIRLGQKNERAATQMVANCFALLTGMALIIMTVTFLFKEPLLTFFGASPAIFPYANEYMSWYLSGTVFALLSAGMNQFIICQGFAKVGMKSVVLGAVSNIVLDPILTVSFLTGSFLAAVVLAGAFFAAAFLAGAFLAGAASVSAAATASVFTSSTGAACFASALAAVGFTASSAGFTVVLTSFLASTIVHILPSFE